MDFTQLLTKQNIRQGISCTSKKNVLEIIGQITAEQLNIKNQQCIEPLFMREKLGSTSIGHGVALPHAKLLNCKELTAIFLQLSAPVNFNAADKKEVDLVFALLIPEQSDGKFSIILQDISKKLLNKVLCKQLRAAESVDQIWDIFSHIDQHGHND